MKVSFTAAQWTVIAIAAVIDGDHCPRCWVRKMVMYLAGMIGPSEIVPGEMSLAEEDEGGVL